jgi:SAM-dependent methyltransferase
MKKGIVCFDEKRNCLVYLSSKADETFWDQHWQKIKATTNTLYPKNKYPKRDQRIVLTQRYLPKGALILEGGAGLAQLSWYLTILGYKTIALDFAEETVQFLKNTIPSVNPLLGDVRDIKMSENSIDGYWSIGVIEHFYNGYTPIMLEMRRVIKPDGVLFLSFPHMSRYRKIKARLGVYPRIELEENADFYQFALDKNDVKQQFISSGFKFIGEVQAAGLKGFKDDVSIFRGIIKYLLSKNAKLPVKILLYALEKILAPLFSHSIILIFRKQNL